MPYQPIVGQPLPVHHSYREDATARAYWRASFRGGRAYQSGRDADGDRLLIQHESESDKAYLRRKKSTVVRNYVGPILRRYNDYIFRRPAVMPEDTTTEVESLIADVDGHGNGMTEFVRMRLLAAQVERESYILIDSTAPTVMERTQAQAVADGDRIIWRQVDADMVPWFVEHNGELSAAVY